MKPQQRNRVKIVPRWRGSLKKFLKLSAFTKGVDYTSFSDTPNLIPALSDTFLIVKPQQRNRVKIVPRWRGSLKEFLKLPVFTKGVDETNSFFTPNFIPALLYPLLITQPQQRSRAKIVPRWRGIHDKFFKLSVYTKGVDETNSYYALNFFT